MPRPARRAALAAALALALAAGCKPSSLAPLWIDERGAEAPSADNINGLWQGIGPAGERVRFLVGSGSLSDILIQGAGSCGRFFFSGETYLLDGNSFAGEFDLESGGRITVAGTFTSGSTCSGSYSFVGVSIIEGCPRQGAGTFVATKVR